MAEICATFGWKLDAQRYQTTIDSQKMQSLKYNIVFMYQNFVFSALLTPHMYLGTLWNASNPRLGTTGLNY